MSRYSTAPQHETQTNTQASLLSQGRGTVRNGPWDWESDDDDSYTRGEETEAEAEDPADYSVNQFINTDDADDYEDDDDKNDDDDTSDNNDVGDFGMDETSDEK